MTFDDQFPGTDFDRLNRIAELRHKCRVEVFYASLADDRKKEIQATVAAAAGDGRKRNMIMHRKLDRLINDSAVFAYIEKLMENIDGA